MIIKNKNKITKEIIEQILANELEKRYDNEKEVFREKLQNDTNIKYLIDAIKFVGEEKNDNNG